MRTEEENLRQYAITKKCSECLVKSMCRKECILIDEYIESMKKWGAIERFCKEYTSEILKKIEKESFLFQSLKLKEKKSAIICLPDLWKTY